MREATCKKCGLCCQLFLVNLAKEEYLSGAYSTVFEDIEHFDDFVMAETCGANILSKQTDGGCIYLEEEECGIHERRPAVCREFFCTGNDPRHKAMVELIESVRHQKMER